MAEMSEEEAKELLREYAQGKENVHSFFTKIIKSDDTTKTGNLDIQELGMPKLAFRAIKELELFSKDIFLDNTWSDYFKKLAEIATSSSLSKEGILIKLSVTNKKELADVTPGKKKNKGWFGNKKEEN